MALYSCNTLDPCTGILSSWKRYWLSGNCLTITCQIVSSSIYIFRSWYCLSLLLESQKHSNKCNPRSSLETCDRHLRAPGPVCILCHAFAKCISYYCFQLLSDFHPRKSLYPNYHIQAIYAFRKTLTVGFFLLTTRSTTRFLDTLLLNPCLFKWYCLFRYSSVSDFMEFWDYITQRISTYYFYQPLKLAVISVVTFGRHFLPCFLQVHFV